MKKLLVLLVLLCSANSFAGLFGPSNFEECILDQMKNIKSDAAANAVTYACRKKFPATPEPKTSETRYGYPRLDIWDSTYAASVFNNLSIIKGTNGTYSFELTLTNKSKINLTGVYIGVPTTTDGKCPRDQSQYREIYLCEGNVNSSTTGKVFCTKFQGNYCIVGIKA